MTTLSKSGTQVTLDGEVVGMAHDGIGEMIVANAIEHGIELTVTESARQFLTDEMMSMSLFESARYWAKNKSFTINGAA